MPRGRRRSAKSTSGLAKLRREVQSMVKRLQRAGQRQLIALERQITALEGRRQALLDEISAAFSRPVRERGAVSTRGRLGHRTRVDWPKVFSRLPKGSPFQAHDVRKLVPGVAAGTLSQRLTAWVKEKKLKRTGSRRGTRYTKAA
jgi:hypothetical protein